MTNNPDRPNQSEDNPDNGFNADQISGISGLNADQLSGIGDYRGPVTRDQVEFIDLFNENKSKLSEETLHLLEEETGMSPELIRSVIISGEGDDELTALFAKRAKLLQEGKVQGSGEEYLKSDFYPLDESIIARKTRLAQIRRQGT